MITARDRIVSRLTLKIFAVNGIALVVLAFGLIYLGEYESNLIKSELQTLERQGRIYSGAIAEAAQVPGPTLFRDERGLRILRYDSLARYPARKMIRRLGQTTTSRIRLYDHEGKIMGDSDWLSGPVGVIDTGPASLKNNFLDTPVEASLDFILDLLPTSLQLEQYPRNNQTTLTGFVYPDVRDAMEGKIATRAWLMNRRLLLSAAVPVINMDRVMGVVYLTRDGKIIDDAIRQMQRDIILLFFVALGITFLLSLYLSGVIGNPLKKLARAANNVQRNFGRGAQIPDLSRRKDEIGDLSVAFKNMTDALALRLDTIEHFAADVAHELKNPLTSLRSAVETLTIVKDKDDQERLIQVILHDVNRLDRLISDISKSSRLDAELSREDMQRVDIEQLLRDLTSHYKAALHIPDNVEMTVLGVDTRLGQVFDNLLSNAKSFSDVVTVTVQKQNDTWQIMVEDKGPGIPDSKLEKIFDRFYTERPDGEAFGNHSGLGLAICRQIIDAHHGRLYAENRYDAAGNKIGARFTVILKAI